MDLIYEGKGGGCIYQCGYREIPRDLVRWNIDLVLYCAAECPPLNDYFDNQGSATTHYFPNEDRMVNSDHPWYQYMLGKAKPAAKLVAERVGVGQSAIVSCSQGVNRSGLVSGLAMRLLTDWNGDKIVEQIQSARNGALNNSTFVDMVIEEPVT
jgi:protein-tyrosine phosphatase